MSLRLLHVLNGLDPELGGPPVAVRNMVVALSRRGVEVELVACDRGGDHVQRLAEDLTSESVTLCSYRISGEAEPLARWGVSVPMLRYLRRRIPQVDVLHVHGAWSVTSLFGALEGTVKGIPTVLTPHETLTQFDIDVSRSRRRTTQKRAMGAALVRLVDTIVFSSELERRDSPIARTARTTVIAHPIVDELDRQQSHPHRADRLTRVGFLGRLHPKKNLSMLIEALARCPDVELSVAGSGPDEPACRRQAVSLGVDSRLRWLGFVKGHAKQEFLATIDVLVMPSQYECFGISAVEALELGVPVIVTDTVGIAPSVTEYGAGIVIGQDAPALASAIARLRDDPQHLDACRAGAARAAAEKFSFAKVGSELEHVYCSLAARAGDR